MSAKQAKRLRQAARGLAVSLDQSGKTIHERGLMAFEHKRASPSSIVGTDAFRSDLPPKDQVDDPSEPEVFAVTAVNRADSLRGIIRTLKKGIRTGQLDKVPRPQPVHRKPEILIPLESAKQ
jgi:hypothetical protein